MSNYTRIKTCIIVASTENAIAFDIMKDLPNGGRTVKWVPKSLIHGGDLIKLEEAQGNETVSFRLMAWKAREIWS